MIARDGAPGLLEAPDLIREALRRGDVVIVPSGDKFTAGEAGTDVAFLSDGVAILNAKQADAIVIRNDASDVLTVG